ncbi:amidase domain-containing protein [Desulforamulus aeronauticus]|uniref:Putative amidase domain-containing protein n=1 Tax=Desulforamulus aeronauticus DSM 10349 TaxID=1121421 RepID=A0A1M6WR94_9FIRM|nr:amidase domain-containing protein [Desulforamulus aeronauticus]SHK96109.1 Putative amidase domain-containing protein [Desulforamulus aeronauticus DSM 10349]
MKKLFVTLIMLCLIFLNHTSSFASNNPVNSQYQQINNLSNDKEKITALVELYFNLYNDGLKNLENIDWDILFNENTNTKLFKDVYSYDLDYNKLYGVKLDSFNNHIKYNDIILSDNEATVDLSFGANIKYAHLKGITTQVSNVNYIFKFRKMDSLWKITGIDTDRYGVSSLKQKFNVNSLIELKEDEKIELDNYFNDLRNTAALSKRNIDSNKNAKTDSSQSLDNNSQIKDSNITPAATVNYTSSNGASYARKYGKAGPSYFYNISGNDCTNFVSQCVWAGYGGWDPSGDTNGVNAQRVSNKFRMTSNWYAGSGGGLSNWENVNSFYSYVTTNTGVGPKGTGYEIGKSPSSFNYGQISKGNVLQGWPSYYTTYLHSIYISDVLYPGDPLEILYCGHTSNVTDQILTEFTKWVGSAGKMRGIRFTSASY